MSSGRGEKKRERGAWRGEGGKVKKRRREVVVRKRRREVGGVGEVRRCSVCACGRKLPRAVQWPMVVATLLV